MQDEIFEMDQFAVNPQRDAGIGELLPSEEARSDRRADDALIETGGRVSGVESRPHQVVHADFREIYDIDFMVNVALTKANMDY